MLNLLYRPQVYSASYVAVNMTLLAFAVLQAIDIACLQGPQQQTRRTLHPAAGEWNRQADTRTDTVPLHIPCRLLSLHLYSAYR